MKLSTWIGKEIQLQQGNGYVLGIKRVGKRLQSLVWVDEQEREHLLPFAHFCTEHKKNSLLKEGKIIRLGIASYDSLGNYLGRLEEVYFQQDEITHVKIKRKKYPISQITWGDVLILHPTVGTLPPPVIYHALTEH